MRVGELRQVLRDSGVLGEDRGEPTPAELADALWLAALRRGRRPALPADAEAPLTADVLADIGDRSAIEKPAKPSQAEPQPSPIPQLDLSGPDSAEPAAVSPVLATLPMRGTRSSGVVVSAAARPQLPDSLLLARAMRPLRRRVASTTRHVLDEEATADLQAEQRLWLPALAPGSEPAFDLALVVDDSESMALWGEKIREFRLLCERLGAFRDVRLWRLSATGDDAQAKPVLRGLSRSSGGRDERELVDPSGRRLILVVTDGVQPWWRPAGPLGPVLARWALASPLAIVQPFPQRLWNRSPLRPVIEEFRPGWPGNGPTIHRSDRGWVAVPILELAPAAMRRWAGIISGTSGITLLPAAALSTRVAVEDETAWNVRPDHGAVDAEPDPAQLVRDLRASVSPAAYELAGYLSAAPLTLPVMRLVQESMMPETGPAELAEVFLSGLLRKPADSDPAADGESTSYVFAAGVRAVLQSTLTRGEALTVLDQVGSYLVRERQGGRPFPVLLQGQPGGRDIQTAAEQFPAVFGRIAGPLLDRIGGPYADTIRREATLPTPARKEPKDSWTAYGPGLRNLYQPVLFVGLGGAGCDIGAELERQLRIQICGPDGNDFRKRRGKGAMLPFQLPSCVQFVYADIDQTELDRLPGRVVPSPAHVAVPRLNAHYVTDLVPHVASYPELAARLRLVAQPVVESWLPPASSREPRVNPLHRGAGQFPTIGRASFMSALIEGITPEVRDIRQAVDKLVTSGEDLHDMGGWPPRGIDVFVAFSVAGGTGAGIFYDYLHIIADTVSRHSSMRVKIHPLVLMPSAFGEGLGGGRPAQLNAGRALLDLFRLVDQQNSADPERRLYGVTDRRPDYEDEVAVTYPDGSRLAMKRGTIRTGFLFSQPTGAGREDIYRSIVSLVLSLVGTEAPADEEQYPEHSLSFADSVLNEVAYRQMPAQDGIGGLGVSTAQAASLTLPVDELAGIMGVRLLREAISQLPQADGWEALTEALRDFARADMADFARRSTELYRRRVGVSYLLPSGSGQLEQFYQLVVQRLQEHLIQDHLPANGSTAADVVRALAGADVWPEASRLSIESSPENAVSFLHEKVTTEIKRFLRTAAPGERPLLPRLHDLLAEAAGSGPGSGPAVDQDYQLRGALAGLLPAGFIPRGSGPLQVFITYAADARNPAIEAYILSGLNLPDGPEAVVQFQPASTESISVVMFRTAMGITEVGEVRDLLRLWASAQSNPQPTDLLRWRQRTGYDFGYLAMTPENRVEILHRVLCALRNGRVAVVGQQVSPERINVRLDGGVTMTLPLTPYDRASSWASLLRAYELWALGDDDLHRRFADQLMRELPSGLRGEPQRPSELYLAVTEMAEGQIEVLDAMLTQVPPEQRSRVAQMRDFWATDLARALDREFTGEIQPAEANLRALDAVVDRGHEQPEEGSWIVAIHGSVDDFEPIGSGVVIDDRRILTCAHVVVSEGAARESLWIAFPRAADSPRRKVASATVAFSRPTQDLAVLILAEPVPEGVVPADLRLPRPADLVGLRWWAFGFPDRDPVGNSADGEVGAPLSQGWVRLDTRSRSLVRPGFSGGGLWSPDYQAVVGIVAQADSNGDSRAITLHQADLDLPAQELGALARWSAETAGEVALTQWGWDLARDTEGARHWQPRARGVSIDSERGWRFRGRTAALRRIVSWLDRARLDGRVLVVTGSPGVGKSAVLGRVVTTADRTVRASLPADDVGVLASVGSVSCAVHAKGKTALEVAEEIARAASARLPGQPSDLAPAIRAALSGSAGTRFNVIVDALDEAASPVHARTIIDSVVLPLTETCADAGVQVIVGTRRRDDGGDLLSRFGPALDLLDLDDPEYFAAEDLTAYALACLQLYGNERPGNPYTDNALALPLAARITELAGQNFLIAGLTARAHGLYDEAPVDPAAVSFSPTVADAMRAYLSRLPPVAGVSAEALLTALAFAESPGLPVNLWRIAVQALDSGDVSAAALTKFARSSAASFLVESYGAAAAEFRLFHPALNDALRHTRAELVDERTDEQSLTRAFLAAGQAAGWDRAPAYLLRSLSSHAARAGLMDDLLADDNYVRHADPLRAQLPTDQAEPAQPIPRTPSTEGPQAPALLAGTSPSQAEESGTRWTQHGAVVHLRLVGLSTPEAEQAVVALLTSTGPLDLTRLLVLDETTRLVEHEWVYQRLDTSHRVERLICIAQGPRAEEQLSLPGNLGGTQGNPVLWVSDPLGIDWKMNLPAVAHAHARDVRSGLEYVIAIISADEVFDVVYRTFLENVPYKVASPGLRLAQAYDQADVFASGLTSAIRRLCADRPGADQAYPALMPTGTGATLDDDGLVARHSQRVRYLVGEANSELAKATGLGSVFRRPQGARAYAAEIGRSLGDLRDLVVQLLRELSADTAFTETGPPLLQAAGIRFAAGSAGPPSPIYQRVAEAIRSGGSLPGLARLLTLAGWDASQRGSESYLPEVEEACPQSLLDKLADPPPGWRAYGDAAEATQRLTGLILNVANREWSPAAAALAEVFGLRAALDGVQHALLAYADQATETDRGTDDDRPAQLGEIVEPVLRDLIIQALVDETDSPSANGAEARATAANRATILLAEWTQAVAASGLPARPSFAVSEVDVGAYANAEAVHIREALLAPITDEMWQLCSPEDLSTLDVVRPPYAVRFASRLNRDALAGTLPMGDIVWTSSGSYAGVLRLLPLHPGIVASYWNQPRL